MPASTNNAIIAPTEKDLGSREWVPRFRLRLDLFLRLKLTIVRSLLFCLDVRRPEESFLSNTRQLKRQVRQVGISLRLKPYAATFLKVRVVHQSMNSQELIISQSKSY